MHFLVVDSRFGTPIYVFLGRDPHGQAGYPGLAVQEVTLEPGAACRRAAIGRDEEFAREFREHFVGAKLEASLAIWERARDRGELRPDLDLDLLSHALAGVVLHRVFMLGELPTKELITRVIDQIILPAATLKTHKD